MNKLIISICTCSSARRISSVSCISISVLCFHINHSVVRWLIDWNLDLISHEITFFIVAGMVPCFGFRRKTVLITQQCFRSCWAVIVQSQGLHCYSCCPANKEAGGAQGAGRNTTTTADSDLPKGYPTPHCDRLSNSSGGSWLESCCWGVIGHWSASVE